MFWQQLRRLTHCIICLSLLVSTETFSAATMEITQTTSHTARTRFDLYLNELKYIEPTKNSQGGVTSLLTSSRSSVKLKQLCSIAIDHPELTEQRMLLYKLLLLDLKRTQSGNEDLFDQFDLERDHNIRTIKKFFDFFRSDGRNYHIIKNYDNQVNQLKNAYKKALQSSCLKDAIESVGKTITDLPDRMDVSIFNDEGFDSKTLDSLKEKITFILKNDPETMAARFYDQEFHVSHSGIYIESAKQQYRKHSSWNIDRDGELLDRELLDSSIHTEFELPLNEFKTQRFYDQLQTYLESSHNDTITIEHIAEDKIKIIVNNLTVRDIFDFLSNSRISSPIEYQASLAFVLKQYVTQYYRVTLDLTPTPETAKGVISGSVFDSIHRSVYQSHPFKDIELVSEDAGNYKKFTHFKTKINGKSVEFYLSKREGSNEAQIHIVKYENTLTKEVNPRPVYIPKNVFQGIQGIMADGGRYYDRVDLSNLSNPELYHKWLGLMWNSLSYSTYKYNRINGHKLKDLNPEQAINGRSRQTPEIISLRIFSNVQDPDFNGSRLLVQYYGDKIVILDNYKVHEVYNEDVGSNANNVKKRFKKILDDLDNLLKNQSCSTSWAIIAAGLVGTSATTRLPNAS